MSRSLFSVAILITGITLLSGVYTYFRAGVLASPDQLAAEGIVAASRDTAVFYAGIAIGVGIIGYLVFRGMSNTSPETARQSFLLLAIGIGVLLEIAGAVVFRMRGIIELTVLHALYIAAYGWLLPQVFPA